MTALRLWLDWLLHGRDWITATQLTVDRQAREIAELKGALADVIGELNHLRNASVPAPDPQQHLRLRRLGSWRATVAAIEGKPLPDAPRTIQIERKSA